jgi:antitoxin component YwqK of YwqJK toxin-antitoxin module
MKNLLFVIPFLLSTRANAEILTLKDGTRLEGKVEGEMDGMLLVRTKYGSLNINKADVSSTQQSSADANVSTGPALAAIEPETLPAEPKPEPKRVFKTVTLSTTAVEKIYFENDVIIATETFDSKGEFTDLQGFINDGSYREYYDNGNLKTEKTVINAQTSGTLKAYYPSGVLQSEAYYLAGQLNGAVRIYNENAKLLLEQSFKDGVPDGWFREFHETGVLKSELFYADGHAVQTPKLSDIKKPEAAAVVEPESMLTVKTQSLARGERFTFYLNNKYVAKIHLDKDFNLTSKNGKIPDGAVKAYDKEGKPAKEFVFLKNEVTGLKIYNEAGGIADEYTFNKKGEAVKK